DELHVPAERQPADFPPRPLAVGPAENLVAEADGEGLRGNPEKSRDEIMPKLMEEHQRSERADERDEDEPERRLGQHQAVAFIMELASIRVSRSISRTSLMLAGAASLARPRASATQRTMSGKRISPARKLATATSLAALST